MADVTAAEKPADEGAEKVPEKASKHYTWHGEDGKTIDYTGTAEMVDIFDDKGKAMCHQFCLSYVSDDVDKSDRPVTFLWNGGPGGSSSMVCIGGMGPVRVPTDGTRHLRNTCPVEDNPYTLLQVSDLVFIDAPGTGYSHVAAGYDPKKVWGVDGDGDAMARTVIAWLNEHNAWDRPHYLYGESYGTTRAAVVYRLLGERGVGVDGVVEQSSILDYAVMLPGNDDYYAGMFPVMAATAQSAGVTGQGVSPEDWFAQAMDFVNTTYINALTIAGNLPQDKMQEVAEKMSEFIGLPVDFIMARKLRIELYEFRAHFAQDKGLSHGRYDTRFTEQVYQPVQGDLGFFQMEDPSYDAIQVVYNEVYQKLLRDMGFAGYPNYCGLNIEVNEAWNWNHDMPGVGTAPMPNVAFDIATALRRNPTSHVIFLGGRHDGATPYWNVIHDMAKMYLPDDLAKQVLWHESSNGHMLYADTEALKATAPVLQDFYDLRHQA
ncbi:peptidase S10 [Coriobacteriaceae bacterium]|nr:peptidase S10 [Coriobacteriaceae bacterium]